MKFLKKKTGDYPPAWEKTLDKIEEELNKEMEKVMPDIEQAKNRALTSAEVTEVTITNHQKSIDNNKAVISAYEEKILEHTKAIDLLRTEISGLSRLNKAMDYFIEQMREDIAPKKGKSND